MDKDNTHIDDDFLKKLVGLSDDEKLPEDFTQKIMAQLPEEKTAEPVAVPKKRFSFTTLAVIGLAAAAVILLLVNVDLTAIFNFASQPSEQSPESYLTMFTSIINIFEKGFSGIKISSITVTAIIVLGALYFIDQLLKKWSDHNHHPMNAV